MKPKDELWLEKRGVGFPHYRAVRRKTYDVGVGEVALTLLTIIGIAVGPTWLAAVLIVLAVLAFIFLI
jgi:hypothetical protein